MLAMSAVLILFSLFVSTPHAIAETPATDSYSTGLKLFQDHKYKEAAESFAKADLESPGDAVLLYNWGLSHFKLNEKGWALALWRKALQADPGFSAARRAVGEIEKQIPRANAFGVDSTWEDFRALVLSRLDLSLLALVHSLCFLLAGWFGLQYLGLRRKSIRDEEPMPKPPALSILFTFSFTVLSLLFAAKLFEQNELRATVVLKSVEVKTAPDSAASSLFSLPEGTEVLVKRSEKDWTQVARPGGLAGWVPKSSVW